MDSESSSGNKFMAWCQKILPRVGFAGLGVSSFTVERTIPQVVAVGQGALDPTTLAQRMKMFTPIMMKQVPLKIAQYWMMRECKLALDKLSPKTRPINVMLSYGATGVPFQSVLYNLIISDTYKHFGKAAPSSGLKGFAAMSEFYRQKIAPGIVWCFIRECCATGGSLYLGPKVSAWLDEKTNGKLSPAVSRFTAGLMAGAACALGTQWMHNAALTAGSMAATGIKPNTVSCLMRVFREKGLSTFYVNYPNRMVVIAGASAVLNMCNIFNEPELCLAGDPLPEEA